MSPGAHLPNVRDGAAGGQAHAHIDGAQLEVRIYIILIHFFQIKIPSKNPPSNPLRFTHHLGGQRLVQLHLDHIESWDKGRRCIVDTAIALRVSGGEGQATWSGGGGVVVLAGSRGQAIVDGIAKGQRTHPVVVAVKETGCVVTGSVVHCGKVKVKEKGIVISNIRNVKCERGICNAGVNKAYAMSYRQYKNWTLCNFAGKAQVNMGFL